MPSWISRSSLPLKSNERTFEEEIFFFLLFGHASICVQISSSRHSLHLLDGMEIECTFKNIVHEF